MKKQLTRVMVAVFGGIVLGSNAIAAEPGSAAKKSPDATGRLINLGVIEGQLKFDRSEITAAPGEKISIVFYNKEEMPHNFILCKKGVGIKKVADAALALGADGVAKNYVPEMPEVLAATPLVTEGQTYVLNYTVPKEAGDYPYVCTFPGHFILMNGMLRVGVKDLKKSALSGLSYSYYEGMWNKLPDFSKLTPKKTGVMKDNLVNVGMKGFKKAGYGLVYKAKLKVNKPGKYSVTAGSDDGGRILINGKKVWEHDGKHPIKATTKKVTLKKGTHDVEIQYFEGGGNRGFQIGWSGPGIRSQPWSKGGAPKGKNTSSGPPIVIAPTKKPVFYRDFFSKAGSRGIGIGYPEGSNALFDANYCRWRQFWRGQFIDARVHWVGRGKGTTQPLGTKVLDLAPADPIAFLASPDEAWPTRPEYKGDIPGSKSGVQFEGYLLDELGRPTMLYRLKQAQVTDYLEPVSVAGTAAFSRVVAVEGTGSLDGCNVFIGRDRTVKDLGGGKFTVGAATVALELAGCGKPVIKANQDGFDLIVPVAAGQRKAQIRGTYQW